MTDLEKELQAQVDYYKHEYFSECELREKLEKALDKACDKLQKTDLGNICDEKHHKQCRENHCFKTCIHARPLTKEEWKEWCIKDE